LDRIGVYELLTVTESLRDAIVDRAPHEDMRKLASADGMRTLQQEALTLVETGTTTLAEVMRSIYATKA
jgi:type IV pilus assembly protein PilB